MSSEFELSYDVIQDIQISWGYLMDNGLDYKEILADTLFKKIVESISEIEHQNEEEYRHLSSEKGLSINRFLAAKMIVTIAFLEKVVCALGPDLTQLTRILRKLGRKHKSYGVVSDDYDVMGQALIFTVQKHLGEKLEIDNFENTLQSWKQFYDYIAKTMMGAAETTPDNRRVAKTSVTQKVRSESMPRIEGPIHDNRRVAKPSVTQKVRSESMPSTRNDKPKHEKRGKNDLIANTILYLSD